MKKLLLLPALAIATGLVVFPPKVIAQTAPSQTQQAPNPQAPPQANAQTSTPAAAENTQAFTGQIVRSQGKFMLNDIDTKTSYQLDDQAKAGDYQGDQVRVSGTLDNSSKLIHVQTIETAGGQ